MSEDCIFCKITQKQAPASVVYEDEQVLAFMDIRPVNEGHVLVIPKQHYVDIHDTPEELLSRMHVVTKRLATVVRDVIKADGISIVQQNGKAAAQDIFHIHVHIIPRFEGQKRIRFSDLVVVSRESLDKAAAEIRKILSDRKL